MSINGDVWLTEHLQSKVPIEGLRSRNQITKENMSCFQHVRIVTLDDIGIKMFVKCTSVTTPPRSVIQGKKDEF